MSTNNAGMVRRRFLTNSTKLIGGGALALTFASAPGVLRTAAAAEPSDIDILNYALTLEHLEANFYVEGLKRFNQGDFASAKSLKGFGGRVTNTVYDYFKIIRDHEVEHVSTLISVITSLGGTPVKPCIYNFGYNNVDGFVKVAAALENTGVMAYDGALAMIDSPDLQTAGATIATVEARHAAYLNLLNGEVPFPNAFDKPKTMEQILVIAGQFIVSCPA